ncbi:thiosulfate/3-mercaptopyruvate sulfurtransferase [Kribbella orskensis]|uniref:Thiosulfate/3-mercaptopyruvate sulfurtransferase n=1 Tax=Kribbella orskensis TaxID=2512216 RepID=A0ABY2B8U5_9ACTN|nr:MULTISPECIES: sulfurtransferase [Kribbella]TCN29200.1 thiosulfate/3-mercaptopyruvate sulfurtransferase [Kribbella sp. VKM Ac-2500]TCO09469.1 thiosulfate/3-mercaptopyruvate sulfurtransferase [Kribbella orskensis]
MNPLISADSLADELRSAVGRPVLFDVTWNLAGPPGRDAYEAGHLPGAYFVDLDAELAGPPGAGGRHPLPEASVVEAALRRAGVDADTRVVVYDGANSTAAARAWWIFRYFGLSDVRVLDGGLAGWQEAGGEVTTAVPSEGKGSFVASPGHIPMLDAEGAAAVAESGVLLDARAPERFAGEVEPMDEVAGHIPGAVNAPTTANVDGTGHFLPAEVLRERFAGLGVSVEGETAVYCGSGVTAAHEALALAIAGVQAPVYVGSWSEWITDPSRPIATGKD